MSSHPYGNYQGGPQQPPPYQPQQPYAPQGSQGPVIVAVVQDPNQQAYPSQQQQPVNMNMQYMSPEDGLERADTDQLEYEFSDKKVRQGFIRKVYGILSIQLLVTGAIIACFLYFPELQEFTYDNWWVMWVAIGVTFVMIIALSCSTSLRRKSPVNYICLFFFTLVEGYLLGSIAASFDADAVIIAGGITLACAIGITLFSLQSKWDFTIVAGLMVCMGMMLPVIGLCFLIFQEEDWIQILYGSIGAIVFAGYLVLDTQFMVGGKHKYALSPEEYIFAALNLYLDIVNLFLMILCIMGGTD